MLFLIIIIIIMVVIIIIKNFSNTGETTNQINISKNYARETEIVEKTKEVYINNEEVYQRLNKYEKEDMSSFSKEYFDWENTPTLKERNIYSINSGKDISFINEEISNQFEFIQSFCEQNNIKIPKIASSKLPVKRIGYSEGKEICTFSFTPFTPTGRIKKVNYCVNIETFPGEPIVDFSSMSIKEMETYNNTDSSDEYPFGSMEFNKKFELIRATYHHWKNRERTSYTLEKKDGCYVMKKLVKQKMSDLELGKPELVIVKNGLLEK